ncbi:nicotinate-nucleotide adenylyltransferase [Falsihalocynthiibacter sp. BN13B15]|uniref:nicotinate-nucleotide adenylyltransferase n=1 Tax=Falsihalocynthiibacter sp. BN13B15 TaxID=3240871 RepID=UPI00350EE64A
MRYDIPSARAGAKIGLLGGSFDPPHAGHVHISRAALKRFGLDEVWWLVSPGNPLKSTGPAPIARRMATANAMITHPRIKVTDFEAQAGTRYTAATLKVLFAEYPKVDFTWLMGADNLAEFHLWGQWDWIMKNVRVGVLARPRDRLRALCSPTARRFRTARLPESERMLLAKAQPPAWCFVNLPMVDISSTQLRANGGWKR